MKRNLGIVFVVLFSPLTIGAQTASPKSPTIPASFTVEKAAGYPLLHRPIFAGFDDQGILYVGESSGENLNRDQMLAKKPHWISRLEDTDGDGKFDKSTKFVDNITLPQGCLWYRGSLYAACPPSIWKFTDTDNDGVADQREEILTGFGFSGNACDTHGPFLSPTGRLYIVQGRHGHEFKDKEGKVYSKGRAGRIYSCLPDGSDVRVHAGGGFDNPVEVDFTEEGECIGTVNILYRDRGDCLMHWVEGGVYPREDQADAVAEFKWTGGLLGPIHNLGHVACSGIMRYRGVHFGEEFKNRWFFTEFNTHKVRYAELKRSGSTFSAEVHEFLHIDDADFHPTDVLEDADGSLLVLNTGGWFLNGCPTSRVAKPEIYGGVYRIRKTGGTVQDDPWGKKLELAKQTPQKLSEHLDDSRPAVQQQAMQLSIERGKDSLWVLQQVVNDSSKSPLARKSALWILSQIGNPAVISAMISAIGQSQPTEVAQVAVTAVSQFRHPDAWNFLSPLTLVKHPLPLQRTIWEACSTMSSRRSSLSAPEAFAPVMMAIKNRPVGPTGHVEYDHLDPLLDHLRITGLMRCSTPERLADFLQLPMSVHAAETRRALIALDQMDDSPLTQAMVLPLLSSEDARLQQTALEVIARHPGWGAETLTLLKTWVAEPELSADRVTALRGFLSAQLNDPAVQGFVAEILSQPETSSVVRTLFWEILQKSTLPQWPESFQPLLTGALQSADDAVTLAALRIVTQRNLSGFDETVENVTTAANRSLAVRCEAVAALGQTKSGLVLNEKVFGELKAALASESATSDDKAAIGRALGNGPLSVAQLQQLVPVLDSAGPLVLPVLIKAFARSTDEKLGQELVAALLKTESSTSLSPDELAGLLRKYPESVRSAAKPLFAQLGIDPAAQEARLAELTPLLEGGNAAAGRNIFFGKTAACSACHAIGGEGGRVGPHLTTIGASRSPKDLLEAIVYPSASFVNGYRSTVVILDDGRAIQGVISAETTDTITLRTQDLQEIRIRRDTIEEQRESSTSIMPKGLDTQLTPEELRNLLAFLQSRK